MLAAGKADPGSCFWKGMTMKSLFVAGILGAAQLHAAELGKMSVLYVGTSGSARFQHFSSFLRTNVAKLETASRDEFKPSAASPFDVVVLDWPQQGEQFRDARFSSPLGKREEWSKPTVLLGSAGLNLAVVWKVRGGSG
jgi:hypothetical protein